MISIVCIVLAFCLTSIDSICTDSFQRTQGQVKLAIQPTCGALTSDTFVNFNSGINLDKIKTIYSFGDSWSATGNSTGGPSKPAVVTGSNPKAGGRASNGLVWSEDLAANKTLMSYAIGGATVDSTLWSLRVGSLSPSIFHPFLTLPLRFTVKKYRHGRSCYNLPSTRCENKPYVVSPQTSASRLLWDLATVFYGINDYAASHAGPGTMEEAAQRLIVQTERLIGVGLENILVICMLFLTPTPQDSPPFNREGLRIFDTVVWRGFKRLIESKNIQFAYVDLTALFTAIADNPHAFGYKSTQSCCKSQFSTVGACNDPDQTLYWIPSHPSKETHRLIAEWIQKVLKNCGPSGSSRLGGPPPGKSSGVTSPPAKTYRS
ncbi:hypothetical protein VP01_1031g3 [Puccinia sorghi]|uniref:Carbohydrate esterase family 16 protein n=1 Tax=Puccinia sorghi TaxID=27349 RepID=A0A0L6VVY9_9BASI|nr:hypothetical protein VP01_1031g3 [Puccinia sorghi]